MQQVVMEDREEQELLLSMEAEEAAATRVRTAPRSLPVSWWSWLPGDQRRDWVMSLPAPRAGVLAACCMVVLATRCAEDVFSG